MKNTIRFNQCNFILTFQLKTPRRDFSIVNDQQQEAQKRINVL